MQGSLASIISIKLSELCVKVSEIMDPEAGHVHRDGVVLACEVLECCPWFEFADLDVYGNTTEEEADDLSTDPDELLELGESAANNLYSCESLLGCAAVPLVAYASGHLAQPSSVKVAYQMTSA